MFDVEPPIGQRHRPTADARPAEHAISGGPSLDTICSPPPSSPEPQPVRQAGAVPSSPASPPLLPTLPITLPAAFFETLSDPELLIELSHLAARERHATSDLIGALMEVDRRRLYLGEGCSSLYTYCTQVLHLSEHAAYGRIQAARAARRFPAILPLLAEGSVTLTAICLLAPHLRDDNYAALLNAARHKSKRHIELLVARLRPRADVPSSIQSLSAAEWNASNGESRELERSGSNQQWAESSAEAIISSGAARPLSSERFLVQMTIARETLTKLREAQDLLRHANPKGDLAVVFDRALTLLLRDLKRKRIAATARPRSAGRNVPVVAGNDAPCGNELNIPAPPGSGPEAARSDTMTSAGAYGRTSARLERAPIAHKDPRQADAADHLHASVRIRGQAYGSRYIPAAVRRQVWQRDGGRCAFVGGAGRCTETGFLEFHHVLPYALGGETTIENLELRCRAHNAYEAERLPGDGYSPGVKEDISVFG